MSAPERSDRTLPGAGGPTLHRVLAGVAALLLIAVWISSGSLVTAVLVLVLVAGVAGLGVLLHTWVLRGPRPAGDTLPDTVTTLEHPSGPGDRVRRALRGLLARPWVRGDALVRAATTRLASEDALVFTPRGQRVAAPHLWVEWNPADLTEVAARWPLDVLARELVDGYVEHARRREVRHLADRTWLHLLAGVDVPVGRVVVTAAFSRPQQTPTASACAPEERLHVDRGHGDRSQGDRNHGDRNHGDRTHALARPRPVPPVPPRAALPRSPEPAARTAPAPDATTSVHRRPPTATTAVVGRPPSGAALWQRVLPVLKTIRGPRRPAVAPARPVQPAEPLVTVGVLVAETPGASDVVLGGGRGATVTVGRDPGVDAVVGDPGVSWRHLTVTRRDTTTWVVADAGSTNGTVVDGHRIAEPVTLRVGGVVGLGPDGPSYRLALRQTGSPRDPDGRGPVLDRTRVEVT